MNMILDIENYGVWGSGLSKIEIISDKQFYIAGMIRVYNDEICDTIANYNSSAYYEPSYVITRACNNGGF